MRREQKHWNLYLVSLLSLVCNAIYAQQPVNLCAVGEGWASNSVNTTVFRKNSLITYRDTQFIAYYDSNGYVMTGKRKMGTQSWQLQRTQYKGNAADAHDVISIMADGDGFLHLSWGMHNNRLRYCKSMAPCSLQFGTEEPMTGDHETAVSYPEFYRLQNGNLLFFYRDGGSGHGNLVINRYDIHRRQWMQLQSNLIDGEGTRNAYWQACTDSKGTVHISWVWRENPDVASNHDLCYACSKDGGKTWIKSTGEAYKLPITAASAEYVCHIPQRSELINQTSMAADEEGHPCIATYWKDSGAAAPQYHLIYLSTHGWQQKGLTFRQTNFSVSGSGTKRIPIARPQIIAWNRNHHLSVALIFRDEERENKISLALNTDIQGNDWQVTDLSAINFGSWEPSYDTELWKQAHVLNLFVQRTEQADAEGKTTMPPQMVHVLEWKP